jgi:hypothetical protein
VRISVILALVTAACGGGAVLSTASPVPSLPPRPTPVAAVATASLAPKIVPPPCFGSCLAGTYQSRRFQPSLTYTVPAGWFTGDQPLEYVFTVGSDTAGDGIFLFRDPIAHSQDPDCPMAADPTIGTSPKELTDWIASLPGLKATTPKAVSLGGLPGFTLDIRLAPHWTHACPYSDGQPVVPLIVGSQPGSGPDWNVGSTGMRIWVLDAGANRRVWIDMEAGDHLTLEQLVERAAPVVESFDFSAP